MFVPISNDTTLVVSNALSKDVGELRVLFKRLGGDTLGRIAVLVICADGEAVAVAVAIALSLSGSVTLLGLAVVLRFLQAALASVVVVEL